MAIRTILTEGDPKLTKVCHPVTKFDQKLCRRCWTTWSRRWRTPAASAWPRPRSASCAAPSSSIPARRFLELVNPEVIETSGEQDGIEGCLSVPGVYGFVKRPNVVTRPRPGPRRPVV